MGSVEVAIGIRYAASFAHSPYETPLGKIKPDHSAKKKKPLHTRTSLTYPPTSIKALLAGFLI